MKSIISYNERIVKRINEIQYHFDEWINGNFEDDPLPYEVTTILFLFSIKNNMLFLNMSGGEYLSNINQPLLYCPLEIQFFNCKPFYDLVNSNIYFINKKYRFNQNKKIIFFRNIIEMLILKYLKNNGNSPLKQTNIYLGEMYKYSNKCIKINNKE